MLRITEAHGAEMLRYWDFSHRPALSITLAVMLRDKIECLIIDGLCDTYDDYHSECRKFYLCFIPYLLDLVHRVNNLRDTDASLLLFYETCV
jgi:hypothetical protein